ncbi:hypothetical protein ACR9E3_07440 [Actinomycetospora sp. C-140]
MSTIIDPELTVRLGALSPDDVARIDRYATAAFLWRRLTQEDALEVARGLHWRAVGRAPTAPSAEIVTALALQPPTAAERDRLAAVLDAVAPAEAPPGAPGPEDHRRVGHRLSVALNLLDTASTIV